MFRIWGADVLGQNLVPEIALARELGICFAGLAIVDEISAERPPAPAQEKNYRGLEAVVQALSTLSQSVEANASCDCCGRSDRREAAGEAGAVRHPAHAPRR